MVKIMPYKYLSMCDIYGCSNQAKYAIGIPGEPPSTYFIICEDCLRDIVENAPFKKEITTIEKKPIQESSKEEVLSKKTMFELRNLAKEKGIRGYTRLSRKELISELERVIV